MVRPVLSVSALADCTGKLSGFSLWFCGLGRALDQAFASRRGGRFGRRLGRACCFCFGGGLPVKFAKELFLGLQPKFEILDRRTAGLLPKVVGQLAGFFKTVLGAVVRHGVHGCVVWDGKIKKPASAIDAPEAWSGLELPAEGLGPVE